MLYVGVCVCVKELYVTKLRVCVCDNVACDEVVCVCAPMFV